MNLKELYLNWYFALIFAFSAAMEVLVLIMPDTENKQISFIVTITIIQGLMLTWIWFDLED